MNVAKLMTHILRWLQVLQAHRNNHDWPDQKPRTWPTKQCTV